MSKAFTKESKALLHSRVGDIVKFRSPEGEKKFKVTRLEYERNREPRKGDVVLHGGFYVP